MTLQQFRRGAGLVPVPDPDDAIISGGGQQSSVRRKGQAADITRVTWQDLSNSRATVPQPYRSVRSSGRDDHAIRGVRHIPNRALVPPKSTVGPRRKVPNVDKAIETHR